jgi:hypothetical protein
VGLPPFPVDESVLSLIEAALDTSLTFTGPDGEHLDEPRRVGGEFGLHQLLDFYSGYDETKLIPEGHTAGMPWFTYPGELYCEVDVIRALIDEVRRLRALQDGES